ncbi:MAG: DUF4097 family beta strand repeat protein [Fidelibacterota bacterium]|nr:MAG: DUF4097 family beta strand repeat protein [Candidatus Neomarinimicrobiota bacterium]
MNRLISTAALPALLISLLAGQALAVENKIEKVFKDIDRLDIELVSGDCVIKGGRGKKITVNLVYDYPENCFEPEFKESTGWLRLKERFRGYGGCSGFSEWTITVPKGTRIEFSSASGELSMSGCEGEFALESASGRIEIEKSGGEFEIDNASGRVTISSSNGDFEIDNASGRIRVRDVSGQFEIDNASGDIGIEDARGRFKVDNASGDIDADKVLIDDDSIFDTASGDIVISIAKSPEHDITLESASGDILLNYNGNPVSGFFEFSARKDRGKIIAPYRFDKEKEHEYNDRVYVIKSFTRDKDTPGITLSTSTGRVELKLK